METDQTIAVDVRGAVKRFGNFTALQGVSLSIRDNEFFTLLGPSGCGKTTLLRMIAGFEEVTEGAIFLFNEEIEDLPPHQRPVNTVFQSYALFPHMTVLQNVMFGLEMRGHSQAKARKRAGEMLDLVQLGDFASRKPSQLSGGQQQRVALARALAPEPKVLLLDEPLSALDLKLRQAMRIELKEIQRQTGITFIFVTHDQEEALTMSDRIAVMSAGQLQQLGTAREIYEQPRNRFVADFIGETNLLDVTVEAAANGKAICTLTNGGYGVTCQSTDAQPGQSLHVSVRPERIFLSAKETSGKSMPGVVRENIFIGTDVQSIVQIDQGPEVTVRIQNSGIGSKEIYQPGMRAFVNIEEGAARLLTD